MTSPSDLSIAQQSRIQAEENRIRSAYTDRVLKVPAQYYSYFDAGHLFIGQHRERKFLEILKQYGIASLGESRILEIGCGAGSWLRDFIKWGARPDHLMGIDLLKERIDDARHFCPDGVVLKVQGADKLDAENDSFDLVLQSTVFSSILDGELRRLVAAQMLRVLKPGGFIIWYDFFVRSPKNHDAQGMSKREIRRLFPDCLIDLRRVTLAPPLARFVAKRSWLLACLLEAPPLLRTHYLGVIRKGS